MSLLDTRQTDLCYTQEGDSEVGGARKEAELWSLAQLAQVVVLVVPDPVKSDRGRNHRIGQTERLRQSQSHRTDSDTQIANECIGLKKENDSFVAFSVTQSPA